MVKPATISNKTNTQKSGATLSANATEVWTDPTPLDKFCPHDEACSKSSGLTPQR